MPDAGAAPDGTTNAAPNAASHFSAADAAPHPSADAAPEPEPDEAPDAAPHNSGLRHDRHQHDTRADSEVVNNGRARSKL